MTARPLPACRGGIRHPDTWHSNDPGEQAEARAVCLACPTRLACQAAVLGVERGWPAMDRHGIWAGLDGEERAALDPTAGTIPAPAPCGTVTAHRQHRTRGDRICLSCRSAQHDADLARATA